MKVRQKKKKKKYVSSSTSKNQKLLLAMRCYIFDFINRKTAMPNLFINRIGRYTHTENDIRRGHIHFDIYMSEIDSNI